jgi:phospholipid transport system transporter-binding protein
MARLRLTEQSPGYYTLEGSLTFASIDKYTPQSFRFLKGMDSMAIDLSEVTASDSAGLALMIDWIKRSRLSRVKLRFVNVPPQLLALASLSGLDKTPYFAGAATSDSSHNPNLTDNTHG